MPLGPSVRALFGRYEPQVAAAYRALYVDLDAWGTQLRRWMPQALDILEIGCGWGSLSLWLAETFPNSTIVGLSNSHGQRTFIEKRAAERGFRNLSIVTGNIVDFDLPQAGIAPGFDRVLSIEMFEHMKNYKALMAKVASWLRPDGPEDALFFVHIFCHRTTPYHFEEGDGWMAQTFFSGSCFTRLPYMRIQPLNLRAQAGLCLRTTC